MDHKSLNAFLTIYRTKNLHKASEQLYISQQGLSKILQNLEKEYNCILFERTKTGVIPTYAGERFYESALRIRRELEVLREDLKDIENSEKSISVACSYGTMNLLYPRIGQFYNRYPNIRVRWKEYPDFEAERMLREKEISLLFYVDGENQDSFEKIQLFSEECTLLVYEGHPFWNQDSVVLRELDRQPLILEGSQFHIYHKFRSLCEREEIHPEIVAETTEISLCRNLCKMGEGVAIVPSFIADMYREDAVKGIPIREKNLLFRGGLAKRKNQMLSEAENKFWKFFSES